MSWRAVGMLFYLGIAVVVGLPLNLVIQSMVDEVNKTRPREAHISPYRWDPGKLARVVTLYRQAYPTGRRYNQLRALLGAGALGFVVAVICMFWPD